MAKGLCSRCYGRHYKSDPARAARLKQQKKDWYFQYHAENLLYRKHYRDQQNFGGNREAALARDNYCCTCCHATEKIAVHHKDRQGRNKAVKNNALDNLVTL